MFQVIKTLGTGSAYGVVLMRSILGWTKDALPLLFDPTTGYMVKNKFRIGAVEDHLLEVRQALVGNRGDEGRPTARPELRLREASHRARGVGVGGIFQTAVTRLAITDEAEQP